jgi:FlaA1/EpsC-like NDP-sugar epimerase
MNDAFFRDAAPRPELLRFLFSPRLEQRAMPMLAAELFGLASGLPADGELFGSTQGRSVLITGAGGSIGAELCRQIAAHRPARLVLYELSESALYHIAHELRTSFPEADIVPCLGDVKDEDDLYAVLEAYRVQTVYHAAAYKHVPLVEHNAVAGLRNNVFGTLHAVRAAVRAGVERFVLISTDKAVRPASIMGASKRLAELIVQSYAAVHPAATFCMVRFGNVLGSSGSVFPLFCRQIAAGGPVTVTHREATRFFMTMPEAVRLVLQAGSMARGGEIFVLDMGDPVRIYDMACAMIRLAGRCVRDERHPDGIELRFIGLRPGEKLHEARLSGGAEPTGVPRILRQTESSLPLDELYARLTALEDACRARDMGRAARILAEQPTGYEARDDAAAEGFTL